MRAPYRFLRDRRKIGLYLVVLALVTLSFVLAVAPIW